MLFTREVRVPVILKRVFRWFDNPKEFFVIKKTQYSANENEPNPHVSAEYLDEKDLRELEGITWAPWLPGNIYLFFTHAWDFLILEWGIKIVFGFILGALSIRSLRLGVQMDVVGILYQYSFIVLLYIISWIVVKVWEMLVLNRLTWNRLSWESFEKYKHSLKNWNVITGVYFGLIVVFLIWMAIAFIW